MPGSTLLFPLKKLKIEDVPIELQFKALNLPEPEKEYPFAKMLGRKWRLDYAWPDRLIGLEIEGGTFSRMIHVLQGYERRRGQNIPLTNVRVRVGGRHNDAVGFRADCEKYSHAAIIGWCVIRVTPEMIKDGTASELLKAAFQLRKNGPWNTTT